VFIIAIEKIQVSVERASKSEYKIFFSLFLYFEPNVIEYDMQIENNYNFLEFEKSQ
jgi:hypothetical protein